MLLLVSRTTNKERTMTITTISRTTFDGPLGNLVTFVLDVERKGQHYYAEGTVSRPRTGRVACIVFDMHKIGSRRQSPARFARPVERALVAIETAPGGAFYQG